MIFIVGYSPDYEDTQPLDLAAQLARTDGGRLHVVVVVPQGWPTPLHHAADGEFAEYAVRWGESAVAEAEQHLRDNHPDVPAEVVWVHGRSAAHSLLHEVSRHDADLLVVGSGEDGPTGHVVLSSATDRILHSSPVPVAIAPRGYRASADSHIRRVTCAFRDDESSRSAVLAAAEVCARTGASLRVVSFGVRGPRMFPAEVSGAEQMVADAFIEQSTAAMTTVLEELATTGVGAVESRAVSARTWSSAFDKLDWGGEDILVVGSSSTGRFARVFLGSNASRIVKNSPVPVMVVP